VKRLRIVSYAINGRGLGHLVRQLAILRWVRRYGALLGINIECWVLTTSEADTLARREGIAAFKMPSKAMMRDASIDPTRWLAVGRQWVMNAVAGLSPDVLVVDTFPGGSFGELLPVLETVPTRVLVARAVKDDIAADDGYRALLPLYQKIIVPDERGVGPILLREREELMSRDEARAALGITRDRAVYVTLGGGGDEAAARTLPVLAEKLVAHGWHVVVAAGPLYMGPERRGPHITWMDRYVPLELMLGVDAAVSAGGYNSVTELMFAGVPTVFLPQPRIADDQDGRARAAAAAGAARLAMSLDEVPDLLEAPGAPAAARALVPHNGARAAAAEILSTVLPAADVAMAQSVVTPDLWARAQRVYLAGRSESGPLHLGADKALETVSVLVGDSPSAQKERDALLAELVAEGALISAPARRRLPAAVRVEKFLAAVEHANAPIETAIAIVRGLKRKFPAAGLDALVDACVVLFPAWARFADWMGAVSLVNALPLQRGVAVGEVATGLVTWLERETDLFDALRRFAHLEGNGARSLGDVLRQLPNEVEA
jgi:UDP-N-acetylglucosamine--N-acetylmuramyl-(pentapeptide) pyrophosphoryl-undecaprenol N-acetylglucosamine transferase